jgi:hypothetical protein
MSWIAVCIPLMVIGVLVATVPLGIGMRHQHKYGTHGSRPQVDVSRPQETPTIRPASTSVTPPSPASVFSASWTVCPDCAAVVLDQTVHDIAVHGADVARLVVQDPVP